jgi:protein TIF31
MTFLRPELLQAYRDVETKKWVAQQINQLPKAEKQEPAPGTESNAASVDDKERKEQGSSVEDEKSKTVESALADQSVIRLEDFKLEFNVDAFVERKDPGSLSEVEKVKLEADPAVASVRAASKYLRETVVPNLVNEVASTGTLPGDGGALTRLLHRHGINVRYLGRLAHVAESNEVVEKFPEGLRPEIERNLQSFKVLGWSLLFQSPILKAVADFFACQKAALIREMIARASKHVLRRTVRHLPQAELACAIAHFLNCLLGTALEPHPTPETADLPPCAKREWVDLTPQNICQTIVKEIAQRYRYSVPVSYFEQGLWKLQLLRELCLVSGLQLELRHYHFERPGQTDGETQTTDDERRTDSIGQDTTAGAKKNASKKAKNVERRERTTTFQPEDVLNIVPIVKGTAHKVRSQYILDTRILNV